MKHTKLKQFKPMLAATWTLGAELRYPLLASPKLDGIRCLIRGGRALTRSLKPVPNKAIRTYLEARADVLEGCDGELMIDDVTFQEITSNVMSPDKEPHAGWYLAVFDHTGHVDGVPFEHFEARLDSAKRLVDRCDDDHVVFVTHAVIRTETELLDFEQVCLSGGFEGVMLRDPHGVYKHGRSTSREGGLLKLKRFSDDEARVVDFVELMYNNNEAFTGELGQTKRSTAKAGKQAAGVLGALVVKHRTFGLFEIGTGFTAEQRENYWHNRESLVGKLAKFKYFSVGVKDKPRHPVFLAWRDVSDLSD